MFVIFSVNTDTTHTKATREELTCEHIVISTLHLNSAIVQFTRLLLLLLVGAGEFVAQFLHHLLAGCLEENDNRIQLGVIEFLDSRGRDVQYGVFVL